MTSVTATTTTTTAPGSPEPAGDVEGLRAQLIALGLDPCGNSDHPFLKLLKKYPALHARPDICLPLLPSTELADARDHDNSDANEQLAALGDLERDYVNGAQILVKTSSISRIKKQPVDYYICFDIEATCVEGGTFDYPNEIIEFPALLIDSRTFEIVDVFHSYVKPTMNTVLTDFCTALTGISQETIDASPIFPEMLVSFQEFLMRHKLFESYSCAFITDGPWDIRDFIRKQCQVSKIARPTYFNFPWVDIRSLHAEFYSLKKCNIEGMLAHRGLKFQGRQHSGIDDARNVAIIARCMWEDGAVLRPNSIVQQTWTKKGKGSRRSRRR